MQRRIFFISLVVLLLSHFMSARNARAWLGSGSVAKLAFDRELQLRDDIHLTGATATSVIRLKLHPDWRLGGNGSLHLFVQHARGLDGDRSFLTVTFNYALLRSIRLDETNAEVTEVTIQVPSSSIRQSNELVLVADQVATNGVPLTLIGSRSFFEVPYTEIPVLWDLGHLRAAFSIDSPESAAQAAILLPVNASSSTLEAMALIAANFMAHSEDPGKVLRSVHNLSNWRGPLFVIGTPSEQPDLVSLRGAAPLNFFRTRNGVTVSAAGDPIPANATDGYVGLALNGLHHPGPVIFVTGNSPAAVLKAAKALASPNSGVAGKFARIAGDSRWPERKIREWDGFIPPTNSFHLSDLTHNDIEVAYPTGATISLSVPPDAVFLDYGHEITLKVTLAREFYLPGSSIVVKLNGSELGRYAISEKLGGLTGSLLIGIPAMLLTRNNVLKVFWQGPVSATSSNTVGWISRDTEFYLPTNYEARLPDLGFLRQHLYPFSLRADFSDVVFVVPDRANADVASALLAAAIGVARLAPSDYVALRVIRSRELKEYNLSNFHLIFLTADQSGRLPLQLSIADAQIANTAKMRQRVWEVLSPWSTHKYVLVISTPTSAELLSAVDSVFAADTLNRLTGDTAFLDGKNTLCVTLRRKQTLADISYSVTMQAWLREHWLALPIVAIVVSSALLVMVRIAFQQNRRRPGVRQSGTGALVTFDSIEKARSKS